MRAQRDEILSYLETLLDVAEFSDYGPQGLQVEGRADVGHVVTGVSGSVALFEAAADAGADMVLVHHGILWDGDSGVVRGALRGRLAALLDGGMSLASYHLCLDAHPELGNNVLGARGLGLANIAPAFPHAGRPIGVRGAWPEGVPAQEAVARIDAFYGASSLAFLHGPPVVRSVGLVSGGAQRDIWPAIDAGLDMFITGEASEFVMHAAREGAIHFVAAGHYNTERVGIRALGDEVARRFGVQHTFVDLPNPV